MKSMCVNDIRGGAVPAIQGPRDSPPVLDHHDNWLFSENCRGTRRSARRCAAVVKANDTSGPLAHVTRWSKPQGRTPLLRGHSGARRTRSCGRGCFGRGPYPPGPSAMASAPGPGPQAPYGQRDGPSRCERFIPPSAASSSRPGPRPSGGFPPSYPVMPRDPPISPPSRSPPPPSASRLSPGPAPGRCGRFPAGAARLPRPAADRRRPAAREKILAGHRRNSAEEDRVQRGRRIRGTALGHRRPRPGRTAAVPRAIRPAVRPRSLTDHRETNAAE